jgi:hypothetical protein
MEERRRTTAPDALEKRWSTTATNALEVIRPTLN